MIIEDDGILFRDKYDKQKYIKDCGEYIKAVGGDGTLLKAINMFKDLGKPFFGVAKGTVNFLMNKESVITNEAKYKTFNLIKVTVTYEKHHVNDGHGIPDIITESFQAFNDVMIGGDMNSWITFDVKEKDDFFGEFKGGGLIISTSQGSTGINKNNGGVVLPLSSTLWTITGDKANRKIDYVIKPRQTIINVQSRTPVSVWVDGSNNILQNVISVEITKGDEVEVIFNDYSEFKKKRRL